MRNWGQRDELLFHKGNMFAVVDHQGKQADQAVDQIDGNRLLNTSVEDLVTYFYDKFKINGLNLRLDHAHVDQREAEIEYRDPFSDYGFGGGRGNRTVTGTLVELTVPFEGDKALFEIQPNTSNLNPPRAIVTDHTILFQVTGRQLSSEQVRQQLDAVTAATKEYIQWQKPSVDGFNSQLPDRLRQRIEMRKAKLLQDRNLVADLGFPMKKRADTSMTYAAPGVRRRIEPKLPPASTVPFKPEPALDEKAYGEILGVMDNMTIMMERSPKAFAHMGEEQLRDHFLVQLNGLYEGNASGETFNYSGKTDILIKYQGRCIFIAECKFWKGEKAFAETVDQLLGYLSWRDTKTAVVVFNRNQNLSAVLSKVQEAMAAYPYRKRGPEVKGETKFRYVCANPSDPAREIIVTVMVFDIPSVETKS